MLNWPKVGCSLDFNALRTWLHPMKKLLKTQMSDIQFYNKIKIFFNSKKIKSQQPFQTIFSNFWLNRAQANSSYAAYHKKTISPLSPDSAFHGMFVFLLTIKIPYFVLDWFEGGQMYFAVLVIPTSYHNIRFP